MASERLKELLNQGIAREIAVSIQYMWQHVLAVGVSGEVAKSIFKETAVTEMKHAEEIAERLNFLGGMPTTKPEPITLGKNVKEMLADDIKAEREAIDLYRQIITLAEDEKDYVTKRTFEKILADEEGHLDEFQTLKEGM